MLISIWNFKFSNIHLFFIRCGDEITISYMSPLTRTGFCVAKDRQKILQDEFGFLCSCQACSKPNDELENRDRNRIIQVRHSNIRFGCLEGTLKEHFFIFVFVALYLVIFSWKQVESTKRKLFQSKWRAFIVATIEYTINFLGLLFFVTIYRKFRICLLVLRWFSNHK